MTPKSNTPQKSAEAWKRFQARTTSGKNARRGNSARQYRVIPRPKRHPDFRPIEISTGGNEVIGSDDPKPLDVERWRVGSVSDIG